jgi:hypothetical protein
MSNLPALPEGFVLENQGGGPTLPPLPPGFVMHDAGGQQQARSMAGGLVHLFAEGTLGLGGLINKTNAALLVGSK